jgi:hypothetical protein
MQQCFCRSRYSPPQGPAAPPHAARLTPCMINVCMFPASGMLYRYPYLLRCPCMLAALLSAYLAQHTHPPIDPLHSPAGWASQLQTRANERMYSISNLALKLIRVGTRDIRRATTTRGHARTPAGAARGSAGGGLHIQYRYMILYGAVPRLQPSQPWHFLAKMLEVTLPLPGHGGDTLWTLVPAHTGTRWAARRPGPLTWWDGV